MNTQSAATTRSSTIAIKCMAPLTADERMIIESALRDGHLVVISDIVMGVADNEYYANNDNIWGEHVYSHHVDVARGDQGLGCFQNPLSIPDAVALIEREAIELGYAVKPRDLSWACAR